jgi:diguanylate cyclase (GGDEF)-like protein/PAS domain S-box-containing protein
MENNQNYQPEELQLLEKIVIKSGELNQQLSVRKNLVAKRQVKPKNQLETQLANNILELRQAYQHIQLQIIENERNQKLIKEQAELLNLVDDAILIRDSNNIISFWNQGAERMYGFPRYEALAKPYHTLLKTQFPQVFSEIQAELFQKGCWEGELVHRKADGTQISVSSRWVLRKNAKSKYQEIIEINKDITLNKNPENSQNEDFYNQIFQGNQAIMLLIKPETGLIVDANAAASDFYGYSGSTLKQMKITDLSVLPLEQVFSDIVQNNWEKQGCFYSHHRIASGEIRDVEIYSSPIIRQAEKLIYSVVHDITDRQKSAETLRKTNEQLTRWVKELEAHNQEIILLGEMSNILQACLTIEEAYNTVAHLIAQLFPNMAGAVFVISNSKQLVSAVASWGDASTTTEMLFTPKECWGLRRGRSHLMESSHNPINCQHSHHNSPNVESLCVPMMAQGEALGVLYLSATETGIITKVKQQLAITVAEQIALAFANLKLHEALQQQSIRDPLTSLFNRRYLEESLEREISRAERKQHSVGIIMLDVDHFKRFNDNFGHDAGDTMLRELGIFIKKSIRASDIACRFGGEELIIIFPEASLEVTVQRAEEIREGIKHLNLHSRHQQLGTITLSLGVAIFPQHGATGEMVIQAADSALYQAKAQGRDRVVVAS